MMAGASNHWMGALLAIVSTFLPGLLLVVAALSPLARPARPPVDGGAVCGVNAAVVGLLATAHYCYAPWRASPRRRCAEATIPYGRSLDIREDSQRCAPCRDDRQTNHVRGHDHRSARSSRTRRSLRKPALIGWPSRSRQARRPTFIARQRTKTPSVAKAARKVWTSDERSRVNLLAVRRNREQPAGDSL
jgi:hypothetical protein